MLPLFRKIVSMKLQLSEVSRKVKISQVSQNNVVRSIQKKLNGDATYSVSGVTEWNTYI